MSCRNQKAVVLWCKENKVGIENLSNVPENARFVGAATPVQFHGDRKFYPAKIKWISGDMDEINAKVEEVEKSIEQANAKLKALVPKKRVSRVSKNPSVASEQALAKALGDKVPVPRELEGKHKESKQASKDAKLHKIASQSNLDGDVMSIVRKNLFKVKDSQQVPKFPEQSHDVDDDSRNEEGESSEGEVDESDTQCQNMKSSSKSWCSCGPCQVMKKYDSPLYMNFLRDIAALYEGGSVEVRYLEMLTIDSTEKKVELVPGTGIFISAAVRDQLKVDFRNKPASLARETLFALFGSECFKVLNVTGKGLKKGSYTIPKAVLSAVCFVQYKNNQDTSDEIKTIVDNKTFVLLSILADMMLFRMDLTRGCISNIGLSE